jgi:hypothetical protein
MLKSPATTTNPSPPPLEARLTRVQRLAAPRLTFFATSSLSDEPASGGLASDEHIGGRYA